MNSIQKRFLLFMLLCIPSRLFLVYLAKTLNRNYVYYMGWLAILPAFGFLYLYFSGARKTGAEVFGDRIWWNSLRPVHAFLYLSFAYKAIQYHEDAWIPLAIDVQLGILSFLLQYYRENYFSRLLG
jgi:hypothetical protein